MPRSRLIVFAVLLMALSACGGGQTLTPPVPAATTPAPARIGDAGVSVDLPSGWSIAPRPTMSVTDPVQRVVVASTPAAINPKRAACNTEASARVFAPTGAMVLVMECTSDIGGPSPTTRFGRNNSARTCRNEWGIEPLPPRSNASTGQAGTSSSPITAAGSSLGSSWGRRRTLLSKPRHFRC